MRCLWYCVSTAVIFASAIGARVSADAAESAPLQFVAGDLQLTVRPTDGGIRLESLYDLRRRQEWLDPNAPSLFSVTLRKARQREETRLDGNTGWRRAIVSRNRDGFVMHWSDPTNPALRGFGVSVATVADASHHAWRLKIRVEGGNMDWGVARVLFPQVALREPEGEASVFFPRGPGEMQTNVWQRSFSYHGDYPGGWCSMPFMAAYSSGAEGSGVYCGLHDPWGSVKNLGLESDPAARRVRLWFDQPAPGLGLGGSGFVPSGEAVLELFRGDWFDAAQIYRAWARREARWWPQVAEGGRRDTPLWMRELSAWVMTGGAPSDCADRVKRFQQFVGLPVGFHWYNWHEIPFDNDYPHYFPAKPGFAEAVRELRQAGVYPMPYINGRLWDTHDRGTNDFEFTRLALPSATKQDDGAPYLERYGSKEANGDRVALAVMCPSTPLWQDTVRGIVLRLLNEVGTSGVYIDQVAAAPPKLCMDARHGHPLGGGHWWNEGYWRMIRNIRRAMPADAMLTTECNGEPFVNVFDGYLTWHWQFNRQVPAFPAVYGGVIQMFGRAYRGGETKDLALRMKAGQQLVFGEQIGWFDPDVIRDGKNAAFLKELLHLRWQLRRYFYAGEMARPPRLADPMPTVTADWQWSGVWPVTTDAVLTGAWRIPRERRLVLLFVNVSDQPVTAPVVFDPGRYGLAGHKLVPQEVVAAPAAEAVVQGDLLSAKPITFASGRARAWELRW